MSFSVYIVRVIFGKEICRCFNPIEQFLFEQTWEPSQTKHSARAKFLECCLVVYYDVLVSTIAVICKFNGALVQSYLPL